MSDGTPDYVALRDITLVESDTFAPGQLTLMSSPRKRPPAGPDAIVGVIYLDDNERSWVIEGATIQWIAATQATICRFVKLLQTSG